MVYHTYMMASASGVLYIGMTNHLERRVSEHKSATTPDFSCKYKTTKLVYFEAFNDAKSAIAREKQWKHWRRQKKIALIEMNNLEWRDLSQYFTQSNANPSHPVAISTPT
jgi:putative endonuclease